MVESYTIGFNEFKKVFYVTNAFKREVRGAGM
jgi:hypothetical protein